MIFHNIERSLRGVISIADRAVIEGNLVLHCGAFADGLILSTQINIDVYRRIDAYLYGSNACDGIIRIDTVDRTLYRSTGYYNIGTACGTCIASTAGNSFDTATADSYIRSAGNNR